MRYRPACRTTATWSGIASAPDTCATLFEQRKLANLRRDPRAVVSFESDHVNEHGLRPYLVVKGAATVTQGGGAALLQRLAHRHLGPDVVFPPMPDPPEGYVTRITVESVGGVGPWAD